MRSGGAESSADGLRLLRSNASFDHIVCDSAFLAESGWKFTAEISRAAPSSGSTYFIVIARPAAHVGISQLSPLA